MKGIINKLISEQKLSKAEWCVLIADNNKDNDDYLFQQSSETREKHYGKDVYIRGLIEFTNICQNDCLYCGLRRSNHNVNRYRLTLSEIMECCHAGYELGFRTFVLQGGEDPYFTDERICDIVATIKTTHPDCAVTLSIGEKSRRSYQLMREAGADRYLLRQETANSTHYSQLHPAELSADNRKRCLRDLKELGFQVGTGFMVGSPFQTPEYLADDMLFITELQPQMVGIGPFLPHHETPFANQPAGSVHLTLRLLAMLRLLLPNVLLPATTALGTATTDGREQGLKVGANVVMPNLSPASARSKYSIYDNKLFTGAESAQDIELLRQKVKAIGYQIVVDRGDAKSDFNSFFCS
ncbi:MAG: [FeFe] hydrogenase H-cluster radical SAM maturase HydE [Bacteroidales bacterium]|nr:[FeFe] hydrogenase H-cluster radical SAM maturase HydE [Bacteroidales bacterium]